MSSSLPGTPAPGADEFVTLMDVTATILDIAGLDPAQAVDGAGRLPLV